MLSKPGDTSMGGSPSRLRSHLTLAGTTVLHAFTHAYGVILMPLYLLMVTDLRLAGASAAALIVSVYSITYCLGSYGAGVLADRFDRKWLLGIGLIGNAAAILAMGLVRQYELLIVLGVLGGLFGTLFHPCANALIPAHYPRNPGLAIGLLGIGAGFGFFLGPQYAGWRAAEAQWQFGAVAAWQRPLVELGLIGIGCGVLFLLLASETRQRAPAATTRSDEPQAHMPSQIAGEDLSLDYAPTRRVLLDSAMRWRVVALAAVLGCRDFAGLAHMTLTSLFLQKALNYDVQKAGLTLGLMMLLGVVVNPLAVMISGGRKRLPMLSAVLFISGVIAATTPYWPSAWILVVLGLYQSMQLGSYAMSDAAMMERVHPDIRGRVVGLFLTLAGTVASFSPTVVGGLTDLLGDRSHEPLAFAPLYFGVGAVMCVSALSTPLIARLKRSDSELALASAQ